LHSPAFFCIRLRFFVRTRCLFSSGSIVTVETSASDRPPFLCSFANTPRQQFPIFALALQAFREQLEPGRFAVVKFLLFADTQSYWKQDAKDATTTVSNRRMQKSVGNLGVKMSKNDINILALAKGEERYIFLYNEETRNETLRTLGRFASNSELSFSWYDAAVMSQKVRKTKQAQQAEECVDVAPASTRFEPSAIEDLFSGEEPIA